MSELRELLVEELQDLLHAETQLTKALPKMAAAAHNPKLRESIEKHLIQTENHVQRLLNRLGLRSRAQVAVWAVRNGLTDQP